MARIFHPAGTIPVIEGGRLVGLLHPPRDLTPTPTTTKVTPMTTASPLGRPLTTKEEAENAAYRTAFAALTKTLGRTPTTSDDAYWTLPKFTAGTEDPELVERYAAEKALAENRPYEAPEAPSVPAEAPSAPVKVKAPTAAPDASGVIYVPGKVCRDCSARIERKPGAGRPPAKCLICRAKDAEAAAAKKAKAATAAYRAKAVGK